MEIHFRGSYDKRMFMRGLGLLDRTKPVNRILRWLSLGLAIAVIGLGISDWLQAGASGYEINRLVRTAVTALLLGYYFFSPYITRWTNVSGLFKAGPNRTMQGQADHEAITLTAGNDRKVVFPWAKFFRKGIRDPLLALMTLDGSMALFHRSFFQTESDWSRFRQLVDQKVIETR
jgi:hypothetical protein